MPVYLVPIIGGVGLLVALVFAISVARSDPGSNKVIEIASAIRTGAFTFLVKEYQYMIVASIHSVLL